MSPTVVLLHGRSQEFKDVEVLTRTWLDGLDIGLRSAGHPPVRRDDVVMPFYGNELYHVTAASAAAPWRTGPRPRRGGGSAPRSWRGSCRSSSSRTFCLGSVSR